MESHMHSHWRPSSLPHTHTRFHICAFESGQRKHRGSDNRLNMDHTCVPGYSEPRTFRSHTGRLRQDLLIRHSVMEQVRAGSHQTAFIQSSILFHIILSGYKLLTAAQDEREAFRRPLIVNGAPLWLATSCSVADASTNQLRPKYGEWVLWMGE